MKGVAVQKLTLCSFYFRSLRDVEVVLQQVQLDLSS